MGIMEGAKRVQEETGHTGLFNEPSGVSQYIAPAWKAVSAWATGGQPPAVNVDKPVTTAPLKVTGNP